MRGSEETRVRESGRVPVGFSCERWVELGDLDGLFAQQGDGGAPGGMNASGGAEDANARGSKDERVRKQGQGRVP